MVYGEPKVLNHRYKPRGAAKELFKERRGEVLLSGPAGTGKSRACLEKLHRAALKYPGMRGLMVRKTLASLTSTGVVTYRERVAQEALQAGIVEYYGGSQQEPPQYRYENGSKIMLGGMDKPTKIMSSEYDMIFVQEAIELTLDDWEALTTRLRNGVMPYNQLIADTNPERDFHWLKKRADAKDTLMLESRHEDNPLYFTDTAEMTTAGKDYIEGKLDKLTGVRYLRLRKGLWVSAEGLIYEDWDPSIHVVPRFDIPFDWARYWSVDFGYTNPFVLQCWASDPDDNLYLYREIYHTKRLVDEHVETIAKLVMRNPERTPGEAWKGEWTEPKPQAIVCDHDAEGRATLERDLGISTTAADKRVSDGIQAVQRRIKDRSLFILADSVVERDIDLDDRSRPASTAEEAVGYIWALTKDQPVKEDDHGMDTMRYLVMELDQGQKTRIRWL